MKNGKLHEIEKLIKINKIDEAQYDLSKLDQEFLKNSEYLYLRAKIFFIKKIYYTAIDALLIATEFEENDKVYNLLSEIYAVIGNQELSKKISDHNLRISTINALKKELTGISQNEK